MSGQLSAVSGDRGAEVKDFRTLKVWHRAHHLMLAHELDMLPTPDYEWLADDLAEVKRMLTGLIHKLQPKSRLARPKADR